jgi:hypothetical protein
MVHTILHLPGPLTVILIFIFSLTFPKLVYSSEEPLEKPNDLVKVHGQTIQGRVGRLGPRGVEFTTIYGDGRITIAYDDLEDLVSQNTFLVFHGKKQLKTISSPLYKHNTTSRIRVPISSSGRDLTSPYRCSTRWQSS